jgi:transposase-like protein
MTEAEIITRRRNWTWEEKSALFAEVEAEGGRVAMVAQRHGLSKSLLYNWRSVAKAAMPTHGPDPIELRPIGVIGRRNAVSPALLAAPESGSPSAGDRDERARSRCGVRLTVPDNITLLPLPAYSPELNPMENVWDSLRGNKLSHKVWDTYEAIVEACANAWRFLTE